MCPWVHHKVHSVPQTRSDCFRLPVMGNITQQPFKVPPRQIGIKLRISISLSQNGVLPVLVRDQRCRRNISITHGSIAQQIECTTAYNPTPKRRWIGCWSIQVTLSPNPPTRTLELPDRITPEATQWAVWRGIEPNTTPGMPANGGCSIPPGSEVRRKHRLGGNRSIPPPVSRFDEVGL